MTKTIFAITLEPQGFKSQQFHICFSLGFFCWEEILTATLLINESIANQELYFCAEPLLSLPLILEIK